MDRWGAVGILESIFHWAAVYARQGDIGRHPDIAIAAGIGWTGNPQTLIAALTETGWLDRCCTQHRLRVHDWPVHADQSVQRTKDVIEHGFVKCYKTRSNPVKSRKETSGALDAAGTGTGTGNRLPAQVTDNGAVKKRAPELERLLADEKTRALSELWVQELGGALTLGIARSAHRFFTGAYEYSTGADAILGIKTARAAPERYPARCLTRWCVEHNDKPDYVLRPEKVEEIAADYRKHGRGTGIPAGNPTGAEEMPRAAAERRARELAAADPAAGVAVDRLLSAIEPLVDAHAFGLWFRCWSPIGLSDDTLRVRVPNAAAVGWLSKNYGPLIGGAAEAIGQPGLRVRFEAS